MRRNEAQREHAHVQQCRGGDARYMIFWDFWKTPVGATGRVRRGRSGAKMSTGRDWAPQCARQGKEGACEYNICACGNRIREVLDDCYWCNECRGRTTCEVEEARGGLRSGWRRPFRTTTKSTGSPALRRTQNFEVPRQPCGKHAREGGGDEVHSTLVVGRYPRGHVCQGGDVGAMYAN